LLKETTGAFDGARTHDCRVSTAPRRLFPDLDIEMIESNSYNNTFIVAKVIQPSARRFCSLRYI